jgi:hypothetical protein
MAEEIRKILEDHEKRISNLEKGLKPGNIPRKKVAGKRGIGELILELKEGGFFREDKTITQIKDALHAKGRIVKSSSLPYYLLTFVRDESLKRRQIVDGKKKYWVYFA